MNFSKILGLLNNFFKNYLRVEENLGERTLLLSYKKLVKGKRAGERCYWILILI